MVARHIIQETIDPWHVKTMSTQFSGPEYHVCDGPDGWGIVGRVFRDYDNAAAKMRELRAEAIQKLFNSY